MLYIVSTPIGNLEDITVRALNILKSVDYIAAEDTRHSGILLNKYEIKTPTISYHSYSGNAKIVKLIDMLLNGKDVAVISDAGTPGISDPAYTLIKAAIENDIQISPIPGASSLLAALVMSGLPMNRFHYVGFLPVKKGRQTMLKEIAGMKQTIVMFESPHRIMKTLNQLNEFLGNRKIAVCREITKIHEETFRGLIPEAIEYFESNKGVVKGEFVLVIGN